MRKTISILSIIVIFASVLGIAYFHLSRRQHTKEIERLEHQIIPTDDPTDDTVDENPPLDFSALRAVNPDIAAWLKIEDTGLSYPVMQNKADPNFYLDHNFEGEKDPNGLPFLDERNHPNLMDDNIIIYGHNMKSGLMFHPLESYLDNEYFTNHNTILLETPEGSRTFRVFAVVKEKISSENSFNYNMFTHFDTPEAKAEFMKQAIASSVHAGTEPVDTSAKLLTLSTCDNITMDGRTPLLAYEITV